MPAATNARINFFNSFGQRVYNQTVNLSEGMNELTLAQDQLGIPGTHVCMMKPELDIKQGTLIMFQ